jgi:diaminohydroxyphosphoribosylaminopyrimidine deaminase/5-amino-6-(5-phosphoribosylamino)uracil reductase
VIAAKLEEKFMRRALLLARRAAGATSPNPLVGAVLVRGGRLLGEGWHRRAGGPHAEIEALRAAARRGYSPRGATLFVTLEPCCTHGRTPPCTEALIQARVRRVIVATSDPNPAHAGRGLRLLRRAGISVRVGLLAAPAARLNESFNHWIVHRTPFVTVKAAMTLDGKIATASGESKWITGPEARAEGMRLRARHDAILVGVNTILADNPSLTLRTTQRPSKTAVRQSKIQNLKSKIVRRIILDTRARTPLKAAVIGDAQAGLTTVVVGRDAPAARVTALAKRVTIWRAPLRRGRLDLRWVLRRLGQEQVTSLLVEGGGEVNASFLLGGFAQRVAFFYAPKILGGAGSRKAVAGDGARSLAEVLTLREVEWKRVGDDLMMTGLVTPGLRASAQVGQRRS